jgi:hypothetical protein
MKPAMNWYGNSPKKEWGPEITASLTTAFEDALQRARDLGIEHGRENTPVGEAIALYIINRAINGIYDPKLLADGALRYLRRKDYLIRCERPQSCGHSSGDHRRSQTSLVPSLPSASKKET